MNYASSIREANRNPSIVFHREKINIGRRRFFYRSIDRQSTVSCSCRRGNRALYCVISPPDRHIRLSTRAKLSPDYICFAFVRFVRLTFSIEFVISLEGERIRLDVSYRVQAYNTVFFPPTRFQCFLNRIKFFVPENLFVLYVAFFLEMVWNTIRQMSLNYNHHGRSASVGMRFQRCRNGSIEAILIKSFVRASTHLV